MKIYLKAIIILALAVLVSGAGCVSYRYRLQLDKTGGLAELSEPSNSIYIDTTPGGANVLINNEFRGITPLTVHLAAGKEVLSLKVTKEGYETEEVTLRPEEKFDNPRSSMIIKSTLFFGVIGVGAGLAAGRALEGLGGGVLLGVATGLLQEEKNLSARYEYPQKDIHIRLSPINEGINKK